MSLFAARCALVGAAVVLVLVGGLSGLSGSGRAALLGAGASCAALDVALVRSGRRPVPASAVLPPARTSPPASDRGIAAASAAEAPDVPPPDGACETTQHGWQDRAPVIDLGRAPDGSAVRLDAAAAVHVVVLGSGALAAAVHRAVATQLDALRGTVVVRAAAAPEVGAPVAVSTHPVSTDPVPTDRVPTDSVPTDPVPTDPVPTDRAPSDRGASVVSGDRMPAGVAVTTALDADGAVRASVVLVPVDDQVPRRWDALVVVTRYGCTVRRSDESRGIPVDPVLPLLGAR